MFSEELTAPLPAPGWYPDPSDDNLSWWWDGNWWTGHWGSNDRAGLRQPAQVDNVFVWGLALLPLIPAAVLLIWHPEARNRTFPDGSHVDPETVLAPVFSLLALVAVVMTATDTVLAYLDRQRLLRAGVGGPFPWAWAFLGGSVYVIGRAAHLAGRTRAAESTTRGLPTVLLFLTLGAVQTALVIVYVARAVTFASGGSW